MKRKWIFFWLIALSPLVLVIVLYPQMPTMIPLRWNKLGFPNCWGPKFPNIFLLPITVLLFSGIASLLPFFGEKSEDPTRIYMICIYIFAFFAAILAHTYILLSFIKGLNFLI